MTIGIVGQYQFKFTIGALQDAISEEDLHSFTLIEKAGNVMPEFELIFSTEREDLFSYLHEDNKLDVSFGKDVNSLTTVSLSCAGIECIRQGRQKRTLSITGLLSPPSYLSSSRTLITSSKSAVEVIKDVVSPYFTPVFNISKSSDTQRWIQPNWSDKKFVNEVWLHADLPGSFPAVGISSAGRFILKDIKKDLLTKPKWRFGKDVQNEETDIIYSGDPIFKIKTGFINNFVGYGREKIIYNLEDGDETTILEKAEPIVALTNKMARSAGVEKKFAASGIINDNTHANYWQSYQRNFAYLAAFGNVLTTVHFTNYFADISVLDQVLFKDEDPLKTATSPSSEFNSGIYYVSKVVRNIAGRQFTTTVELCREALNQLV